MKVDVKHVIEIAGGVVLGGLAHSALNGVGKFAKNVVVKIKEKAPKKA